MVADDDLLIREFIRQQLESKYKVVTCENGELALSVANNNDDIALAILDFDMPERTGVDAGALLWGRHKIPFLIMSRFDDEEKVSAAAKAGAMSYLVKPIDARKILPAVAMALSRAQDRRYWEDQSAHAIELANSLNQSRRVLNEVVGQEEAQRKEMVDELHDYVGQALTTIRLTATAIDINAEDPVAVRNYNAGLIKATHALAMAVRSIMLRLRPEILEMLTTGAAIRYLANTWQDSQPVKAQCSIKIQDDLQLTPPADVVLYRAVMEALTNVSKHAKATRVRVDVQRIASTVVATIEDNGIGFDSQTIPAAHVGMGMIGTRERIAALGGSYSVVSKPGKGTSVTMTLPALLPG